MRKTLYLSAALLGIAVGFSAPAMAQTEPADATAAPMQGEAMPGKMHPKMHSAGAAHVMNGTSNAGDGNAGISAPGNALAEDRALSPDANPRHYLTEAQTLLQRRQALAADNALERAETRLLDRSTLATAAGEPDSGPLVRQISQAREALAKRNWPRATQLVADALATPGFGDGAPMAADAKMGGKPAMSGGPDMSTMPPKMGDGTGDMGAGGTGMGQGTMAPASQP